MGVMDAEAEQLEQAIMELTQARELIFEGKYWSAYEILKNPKHRIFTVQSDLTLKSPKAALDWGNGIRMPDGKIGILRT